MSEKDVSFEEVLDAFAKKVGMSKERVKEFLAELAKEYLLEDEDEDRPSLDDVIKLVREARSGGNASQPSMFQDPMQTMLQALAIQTMRKAAFADDFNINPNAILVYAMLRDMLTPRTDPITLLLIDRLLSRSDESKRDEVVEAIREMIQKQIDAQKELQQILMSALLEKKWEKTLAKLTAQVSANKEAIEKTNKRIARFVKRLAKRIKQLAEENNPQKLAQYLAQLGKVREESPETWQQIVQFARSLREAREAIEEAAEVLGIKPEKPVVTPEGKVDVGALLDKLIKLAETWAKYSAGQQQPPPPPPQPPPPPPETQSSGETQQASSSESSAQSSESSSSESSSESKQAKLEVREPHVSVSESSES